MIAYKGFTKDLTATRGNGVYQFTIGKTAQEACSKTVRSGFHCCENPLECTGYYGLDGENRFFRVEAAGDINEDGREKIACTKLTLIKELTPAELAYEGMKYMIEHPLRKDWKRASGFVIVAKEKAEAKGENNIAIARGEDPSVKGKPGSILGLIVETKQGEIKVAKLFRSTKDAWMKLTEEGELEEVEDEEKTD